METTNKGRANFGVFLGRFAPFHLGHLASVKQMLVRHGRENSLLLIGSSNTIDDRTPWDYTLRKALILETLCAENIAAPYIAGIPDQPGENEIWLRSLYDIIKVAFRCDVPSKEIVFYCGTSNDLLPEIQEGCSIEVIDRRPGELSGTRLRTMAPPNKWVVEETVHPAIVQTVFDLLVALKKTG